MLRITLDDGDEVTGKDFHSALEGCHGHSGGSSFRQTMQNKRKIAAMGLPDLIEVGLIYPLCRGALLKTGYEHE